MSHVPDKYGVADLLSKPGWEEFLDDLQYIRQLKRLEVFLDGRSGHIKRTRKSFNAVLDLRSTIESAIPSGDIPGDFTVTGGTLHTWGPFTVHLFRSNGTLAITGSGFIDIFMVGGGGGGGSLGGGGAGQLIKMLRVPITQGTYPIVIGAVGNPVGSGSVPLQRGGNGGNTTFKGFTAVGGGGGGSFSDTVPTGASGASGGGGGADETTPFTGRAGGSPTAGTAGGAGRTDGTAGGGGGGASGPGQPGTLDTGGRGGFGVFDDFYDGIGGDYASGGGGAGRVTPGNGGGTIDPNLYQSGGTAAAGPGLSVPNSGSGGGAKYGATAFQSAYGGAGIVMVRTGPPDGGTTTIPAPNEDETPEETDCLACLARIVVAGDEIVCADDEIVTT